MRITSVTPRSVPRSMARLALSVAALTIGGCIAGQTTAPISLPTELSVASTAWIDRASDSARLTAPAGTLHVDGYVGLGSPCYTLKGASTLEGSTITVTIDIAEMNGLCVAMMAAYQYSATVHPTPGRSYDVVLLHRRTQANGSVSTGTVFDGVVTIQ